MKLNFWQWIGVILVVGGGIWFIYKKMNAPATNQTPSTTKPAGGY